MPRPAKPSDTDDLARIQVAAWNQTYPGLLPPREIQRRTFEVRQTQWASQIANTKGRIMIEPGLGFAHFGPQREPDLKDAGYADELYAIYIRAETYGQRIGLSLLRSVVPASAHPFTACVVAGNARATRFYLSTGARILTTRRDRIGETSIDEHVMAWDNPAAIHHDR